MSNRTSGSYDRGSHRSPRCCGCRPRRCERTKCAFCGAWVRRGAWSLCWNSLAAARWGRWRLRRRGRWLPEGFYLGLGATFPWIWRDALAGAAQALDPAFAFCGASCKGGMEAGRRWFRRCVGCADVSDAQRGPPDVHRSAERRACGIQQEGIKGPEWQTHGVADAQSSAFVADVEVLRCDGGCFRMVVVQTVKQSGSCTRVYGEDLVVVQRCNVLVRVLVRVCVAG
jgi:hypothetical protein